MEWENWVGKNIFVKLIDNSCYNGVVQKIEKFSDNILIHLIDKYGDYVMLSANQILKLKDETNVQKSKNCLHNKTSQDKRK